ncbi:MAG: ATPase [Aphanocapsa feldmannii 277cV]|uniref:ATPase n=1 Tax=Aphanocapsa feldmannii 277cV TaxID=2507553 RepID=A0A524RLY5_9CHRO|nr:MAG: ATPase [Aphanocapsa feldmannii 277cV]
MAKIEGIRIRNFRVLKDIILGKLWNTKSIKPLTPMTAVIGKNGVGKSSLFDAFGFLADCLKFGVEEACDARGRGGFQHIRSLGSKEPIQFEVYYREEIKARPITYELSIDIDDSGRPYVARERLRQRRSGQKRGQPFSFLIMESGKGLAWNGEVEGLMEDQDMFDLDQFLMGLQAEEKSNKELIELQDKRKLGIATLGALKQHPRIASFRQFIEGWYLSYFTPDAARSLPLAGPQKHLNIHGDNLGNVVQFIEREHPSKFKEILARIAEKVPGIDRIETERSPDGRLLLRFNDKGFDDPFYAQQMSDGTLKVFAYLIMLEDPSPPAFICVEEPENGLYHKLLEVLATEFRAHATGKRNSSQIFVTTHQPYFIDALSPQETWVLEKQDDGFATIRRASDDNIVNAMAEQGLPLGSLWYSDYLERG